MKLFRAIVLLILLAGAPPALAVPGPLDDAHQPAARLLQDYVRVDRRMVRNKFYDNITIKYGALGKTNAWKEYRRGLLRYNQSKIKAASERDRKAFWINTYNALVIDRIIEEYPLAPSAEGAEGSIRNIPDFFTRPAPVARMEVSLHDIETMLGGMNDGRVWFALHQGTVSSPILFEEPYNPTKLEEQLDRAVQNFLTDPRRFRLDQVAVQLHLSEFFRDRADEFTALMPPIPEPLLSYPLTQRPAIAFLLPHLPPEERQFILSRRPAIHWLPYYWNLNAAK